MQGEGVNAKLGLPAMVEAALADSASDANPADRWLIAVRDLASHIVAAGDVLAIAVPAENGSTENVRLLRQWALAAADVIVAAGDGTFVAKWALPGRSDRSWRRAFAFCQWRNAIRRSAACSMKSTRSIGC
ncbi:hypothetical protein GCM10025858_30960 [Alicyclobacillus sacchari]|uniref:hypothetical protein n=1 Tax=Alicyclobacillus sacchari TaxID=392010 RepID=UPI0023E94AA4|nr:hypothetical protein [Alicyclobacillus sacchari]GMA58593.1 hypothetical protein GCM10025858_30960 [Alicyclobacillus sacchari]